MEQSGLNWKWPEHDGILWYEEENIMENIEQSKQFTKRGSYIVRKISKYLK